MRYFIIGLLITLMPMIYCIEIKESECGQWTTQDREIFCIDRDTRFGFNFGGEYRELFAMR